MVQESLFLSASCNWQQHIDTLTCNIRIFLRDGATYARYGRLLWMQGGFSANGLHVIAHNPDMERVLLALLSKGLCQEKEAIEALLLRLFQQVHITTCIFVRCGRISDRPHMQDLMR